MFSHHEEQYFMDAPSPGVTAVRSLLSLNIISRTVGGHRSKLTSLILMIYNPESFHFRLMDYTPRLPHESHQGIGASGLAIAAGWTPMIHPFFTAVECLLRATVRNDHIPAHARAIYCALSSLSSLRETLHSTPLWHNAAHCSIVISAATLKHFSANPPAHKALRSQPR
ncbi:hypothetical protein FIBSPDRAFT_443205 [Athelia psychrophila]|uniref:Uncharacterized protein n=1 Tax=Athelia psychrophila TaxID=1759441 RepID=A0A167UGE2_9AGAM|nr:hypothetical protein FIBSPDRAFT_443205 [Fibularhizoctonia sp. CBS 109695]